jgi:hypothetical protein
MFSNGYVVCVCLLSMICSGYSSLLVIGLSTSMQGWSNQVNFPVLETTENEISSRWIDLSFIQTEHLASTGKYTVLVFDNRGCGFSGMYYTINETNMNPMSLQILSLLQCLYQQIHLGVFTRMCLFDMLFSDYHVLINHNPNLALHNWQMIPSNYWITWGGTKILI